MTDVTAESGVLPDVVEPEVEAQQPTVLITEQEVLFSTAVAVPLPRTKSRRRVSDVTRSVADAIRSMFHSSAAESRPKPRHYPPRNDFLESSRMAREMYRL